MELENEETNSNAYVKKGIYRDRVYGDKKDM
jgi:hypothetical protein